MERLDNKEIEKNVIDTLSYQEQLWDLFCCGDLSRDQYDDILKESTEQHNKFLQNLRTKDIIAIEPLVSK